MSCWLIATLNCTISPLPVYAFLPYTDLPGDQICFTIQPHKNWYPVNQFNSSTMVTVSATSPISMTLWKEYYALCKAHRKNIPAKTDCRYPPHAVYNIDGGKPENLLDFIHILQEELVFTGILPSDYYFEKLHEFVNMQPGDIPITCADSKPLEEDFGYRPTIGIREGLHRFAEWYKEYYHCPSCRNR